MYYLLLNGAQVGPLNLTRLIELWRERRINTLTLYWEEGNADWLPLHNIEPLLEAPSRALVPPVLPSLPPTPVDVSAPVPPPSAPAAGPASRSGGISESGPVSSTDGEEVLWTQHPTLWHWMGELIWGVLLTPILIGIPLLVHVFWARSSARYRVTRTRVCVEDGIFTRASRELRIADIRSIAARANMFGIGEVEFSTAARADAEVVFRSISGVERVRDLVKQLQNR